MAEDFNWWSDEKAKRALPLKIKLGYVLRSGTHKDVAFALKNFSREELETAYGEIKDDSFKTPYHRKAYLEFVLAENAKKHSSGLLDTEMTVAIHHQ